MIITDTIRIIHIKRGVSDAQRASTCGPFNNRTIKHSSRPKTSTRAQVSSQSRLQSTCDFSRLNSRVSFPQILLEEVDTKYQAFLSTYNVALSNITRIRAHDIAATPDAYRYRHIGCHTNTNIDIDVHNPVLTRSWHLDIFLTHQRFLGVPSLRKGLETLFQSFGILVFETACSVTMGLADGLLAWTGTCRVLAAPKSVESP